MFCLDFKQPFKICLVLNGLIKASSIDAFGQYLASSCTMLTYFAMGYINKTLQVTVLGHFLFHYLHIPFLYTIYNLL